LFKIFKFKFQPYVTSTTVHAQHQSIARAAPVPAAGIRIRAHVPERRPRLCWIPKMAMEL
jgi:hypothetical protein